VKKNNSTKVKKKPKKKRERSSKQHKPHREVLTKQPSIITSTSDHLPTTPSPPPLTLFALTSACASLEPDCVPLRTSGSTNREFLLLLLLATAQHSERLDTPTLALLLLRLYAALIFLGILVLALLAGLAVYVTGECVTSCHHVVVPTALHCELGSGLLPLHPLLLFEMIGIDSIHTEDGCALRERERLHTYEANTHQQEQKRD
jgi:hypothetical protein